MNKEVSICGISIVLAERDEIVYDAKNVPEQLKLFSQSLMVIDLADGECLGQFRPARVQSCMDRSVVRMEPVLITKDSQNVLTIAMLGTTETYDTRKIEILCKPWSPDPPRKGCGDCSRCRRCWN